MKWWTTATTTQPTKVGFMDALPNQSVLRLSLEGLGVTKLPGDASKAPAMWEFFNTP
jgi:hypothetical protein